MTLLRRSAVIGLLMLLMQLCCTQAFEVFIVSFVLRRPGNHLSVAGSLCTLSGLILWSIKAATILANEGQAASRPHVRHGKPDALFCSRTTTKTTRLSVEACSHQAKELKIVTSEVTRSQLLSSSYPPPLAMKNQTAGGELLGTESQRIKDAHPN